MKASKILLLCSTFLVSCSPIPATTTAQPVFPSYIPIANVTNITFNSIPIPSDWHGQPYCTPTGPGVCNFAFYWFNDQELGVQYDSFFVYDRSCNVIGWETGAWINDFGVYSQLPYVVVGQFNGLFNMILSFKYAGSSYGDNCYSYCGSKTCTAFVKQCAFRC